MLTACPSKEPGAFGLRVRLELDDGLIFPALDSHQVAQCLRCGLTARTIGLADDSSLMTNDQDMADKIHVREFKRKR